MSDLPDDDELEPEPDLDAPERHLHPGRPKRADWRPAPSLAIEPPGCAVLIDGTWTPFRVRARLQGVLSSEYALLAIDGEDLEVPLGRIRRYRPLGAVWLPGDLVLLQGVDADAWRGVVRDGEGDQITVETAEGVELVASDALESAWARTEPGLKPVFKRGPASSDPIVEEINTAFMRAEAEPWAS